MKTVKNFHTVKYRKHSENLIHYLDSTIVRKWIPPFKL